MTETKDRWWCEKCQAEIPDSETRFNSEDGWFHGEMEHGHFITEIPDGLITHLKAEDTTEWREMAGKLADALSDALSAMDIDGLDEDTDYMRKLLAEFEAMK